MHQWSGQTKLESKSLWKKTIFQIREQNSGDFPITVPSTDPCEQHPMGHQEVQCYDKLIPNKKNLTLLPD